MHRIHKVLVTGSSGTIGRLICPFLKAQGFYIRGFDMRPFNNVSDFIKGRLEDKTILQKACKDIDAIIHLAAASDESDFLTQLVPANLIGVYNVLESARAEKVKRVILASSIQAVNLSNISNKKIGVEERSPTNFYGLLKTWAEDLGRLYSHLYSLSVIAVRIGWLIRNKEELQEAQNTPQASIFYLSHNDAKEFFLRCLLASDIKFTVLYALSCQQDRELFDMALSKSIIGFEPKDTFPQGLDLSS